MAPSRSPALGEPSSPSSFLFSSPFLSSLLLSSLLLSSFFLSSFAVSRGDGVLEADSEPEGDWVGDAEPEGDGVGDRVADCVGELGDGVGAALVGGAELRLDAGVAADAELPLPGEPAAVGALSPAS
jgi:hypothetical protein